MHIFLGVDPGLSRCGLGAVVRSADGSWQSSGVSLVQTQRDASRHTRRIDDDLRRHFQIFSEVHAAIERLQPRALGIEVYAIRDPKHYEALRSQADHFLRSLNLGHHASHQQFQAALMQPTVWPKFLADLSALRLRTQAFSTVRGRGSAAKTYGVYVAACCAAWQAGLPVYPFVPADVKRWATGYPSATKQEVADAVNRRVLRVADSIHIKNIAARNQEHVYDATALAMLAGSRFSKIHGLGWV